MQFRPSRVVTVTTQQELDSAFGSADELIVEGDDALLSYAATKASGDPDSTVAVELGHETLAVGAPPKRRGVMAGVAVALVVAVALLAAGVYFFVPFPEAAAPPAHHHEAGHPGLPSFPDLGPAQETG